MFYLSFIDLTRPEGDGFIGACFVHADTFKEAISRSHIAACNPGGQARGWQIDPGEAKLIPEKWIERVLTVEDLKAFDAEMSSKPADQGQVAHPGEHTGHHDACADCNQAHRPS